MNGRRVTSFHIRPRRTSDGDSGFPSSPYFSKTDIVDLSNGRNNLSQRLSVLAQKQIQPKVTSVVELNGTIDGSPEPVDHFVELVLATKENTENVGFFITDGIDAIKDEVVIPFYDTVTEGANFEEADWKDQPCVRQANIKWRNDSEIVWLERHMEMTQGFILIGSTPGLMILGEPTHDREDLSENDRHFPDITRLKGYIVPAGCGIIIKKGTWHDFPVSVGPDLAVFIINTREVVDALMSMTEPGPMDFGDCYKIRNSDSFQNIKLRFPDPRPFVKQLGLLTRKPEHLISSDAAHDEPRPRIHSDAIIGSETIYGEGMVRVEVGSWDGRGAGHVWIVPIINVEAFQHDTLGPSVQPHLNNSVPEIANRGWRDYGNMQGLKRLGSLFSKHNISCTAVVSSDLTSNEDVIAQLRELKQTCGWEIGAHGANNSNANHAVLSGTEEEKAIVSCITNLELAFGGEKVSTWLTPGFCVSNSTSKILLQNGMRTLLDFTNDDKPFKLIHDTKSSEDATSSKPSLVCLPYSMETNDFTLILTRHLSPREYAAALESHILQLSKEAQMGSSSVICLGMHTFLAGTPAVAFELDKLLARLKNKGNISWTTAHQMSNVLHEGQHNSAAGVKPISVDPFVSFIHSTATRTNGVIQELDNSGTIFIHAIPNPIQVKRNNLALLLIDIQRDFMSKNGFGEILGNDPSKLERIIAPTQEVLTNARLAGLKIFHTREGHRPNLADLTPLKASKCSSIGRSNGCGRMMVRGHRDNNIIPELKPLEDGSETVIDKPGKSAFYQTDLELVLRNANIDTLLVCGVTTEVCVHSTVRDANDKGIRCVVLEDCTASYFDEFHDVGIKMIAAQGGIFGWVSESTSVVEALRKIGV